MSISAGKKSSAVIGMRYKLLPIKLKDRNSEAKFTLPNSQLNHCGSINIVTFELNGPFSINFMAPKVGFFAQ